MHINIQPIEKYVRSNGIYVDLHSVFETIQGEGPFCGTPCMFVRLAGCNLQCPGCDTEYTEGRRQTHIQDLVDTIKDMREGGLVVITGGEPFRQNISALVTWLVLSGYFVQIESNGTLACDDGYVVWNKNYSERKGAYIVCSPKTPKIHPSFYEHACAFKYVLEAEHMEDDGLPTTVLGNVVPRCVARPPPEYTGPVYLQPMDSQNLELNNANLAAAIQSSISHGYILQLQIHKYIGMA